MPDVSFPLSAEEISILIAALQGHDLSSYSSVVNELLARLQFVSGKFGNA